MAVFFLFLRNVLLPIEILKIKILEHSDPPSQHFFVHKAFSHFFFCRGKVMLCHLAEWHIGPLMFLIYVNDLPESVKPSTSFGYADDFKVIAKNYEEAIVLGTEIEKWSLKNQMVLNMGKSKALRIKGNTEPVSSKGVKLGTVNSQKDLGVIMTKNISWNENIKRRTGKAWRAFFNLKRNISCYANLETKLNAYVGYVVPVISYASQVW